MFENGRFGPLTEAIALKTSGIVAEDFRGRVNANNIEIAWWSRSNWDYAEVWRSTTSSGDNFSLYATTTETPFFDMQVETGNVYRYKVRLVKDAHTGPFSDAFDGAK